MSPAKPPLSERSLVAHFEAGTLDPAWFGHDAHVRVAWLSLREHGLLETLRRQAQGLQRLTRRLGVPGKYHETITVAYALLIAERMQPGQTWPQFEAANRDLFERGAELLSRHWSKERLFGEEARAHFVVPDQPFDRDGKEGGLGTDAGTAARAPGVPPGGSRGAPGDPPTST